ncbi:TetR/AcrR family transcriptional regulator [Algimonas porphyrae]|uniref:TetR family transcriptional regulator n=1 Tax=Algimonas porphyrae TaxID=1128113 RepID=A0ABQ5V4W8_9PROT|nr:TetR/AcrR family transcriptional regulator [Algimonas porphyrae]GLQ21893.1 TetR family transcriptional regulator [Algimonas porphyrae]
MTERSKTKDTILRTAQALFNNEGEHAVSSVDLASVIGISPGNLYYHYKGKDPIIRELFADFEIELRQVLSAPINEPLALQDNWVYLYIIFEEIWDFRFFYRNPATLIDRVPELAMPFSRLLALKERTAFSLLSDLEEGGHLHFGEGEKAALSARLSQHFTFWLQYHQLREGPGPENAPTKALIDRGVYQSLSMIAPYWAHGEGFADLLREAEPDSLR